MGVSAKRLDIENHVKKIVSEVLDIDGNDLDFTANLTDELNVGSLELAELLISIDSELNVHISDEDAKNIHTISALVDYIEKNA